MSLSNYTSTYNIEDYRKKPMRYNQVESCCKHCLQNQDKLLPELKDLYSTDVHHDKLSTEIIDIGYHSKRTKIPEIIDIGCYGKLTKNTKVYQIQDTRNHVNKPLENTEFIEKPRKITRSHGNRLKNTQAFENQRKIKDKPENLGKIKETHGNTEAIENQRKFKDNPQNLGKIKETHRYRLKNTEAIEKQGIFKEIPEKQRKNTETVEKQGKNTETVEKQRIFKEIPEKQRKNKEMKDTETVELQRIIKEIPEKQRKNTETVELQRIIKQIPEKKRKNTETVEKQRIIKEIPEKQRIFREIPEIAEKQRENTKILGKQQIFREIPEKQRKNTEAIEKQAEIKDIRTNKKQGRKITEIKTKRDYEKFIAENRKCIIFHGAKWCGPCGRIKPFYYQMEDRDKNIAMGYVDIDVVQLGVNRVPLFVSFRRGKKVETLEGAKEEDLKMLVENVISSE